ncbi:type IV secretion protein Dot [Legionella waltersii]|uniref:Substrate of the Dot/Icm secretion system n=1 Tax=Legionella waltersii TaxID=66969 RepID=A0A0W1ANT9_9GAMM|nr:type IV secretion protein Dot [Legionella waltersii]KTD82996.1 substrate of the Dot/Icm secretion system [Legionella waltersii]SNV07536.1 Dot/Icm secretion system substrate [Legionella waltersii]
MRYILPAGALLNIYSIRKEYEGERHVNLDETPSLFGVPTLFGGTDVKSRDRQTKFILKMIIVLRANFAREEEITSPEEWEANLTASRVVLAACLFVQSQISTFKNNSALYRLINKDLGITSTNYLDKEDEEMCFLAANRVINSSLSAYSDANAALRKQNFPPFSEKEWREFSDFVATQAKNAKKPVNPYTNYPVTTITQRFFGAVGTYTGATVGYIGGDVISQSSTALSSKAQLTTYVGSSLLFLGTTGPMGVALFSQVIASKIITSFCNISMASLLGTIGGLLGEGIGVGVGMPIDMVYRLLWRGAETLISYSTTYPNDGRMTGLRISDGKSVINGIVLDYSTNTELATDLKGKTVTITEDRKLLVDGKELKVPTDGASLPIEVINELKKQINIRALKKELENNAQPNEQEESQDEEKEELLSTASTL